MGLKAVVDDIDSVDEHLRPLYKEHEGKHVLDVEPNGTFALEDVGGLKSALGRKTEELRKIKETIGDLDPEAARKAMARLEELEAIDPTKEADRLAAEKLEAERKRLVAAHQKELEAATSKAASYQQALTQHLLQSEAMKAIMDANGIPDLLMPVVEKRTRVRQDGERWVTEVIDPKTGAPEVVDGQGNPKTIAHLMQELRQSDAYAPAFRGTDASGSGAQSPSRAGSPNTGRLTAEQAGSLSMDEYRKARQEGRL